MSNADKTLICKKGKLAKNNATRQLIRNKLVTSGSTIKGTAPMRAPGGKKGSHACTQFKGMNSSHVFDDTFSSSSSGAISDSNFKMDMFLRKSPYFPTSHSNDTCPMDVSTNGDSQKGPESGRFVTKTAPVGDSVGAGEIILFDAEDMFDMQQTSNSYDFNEACIGATEEQFNKTTVVAPDALTFHPSADRWHVCDSPEQPKTPGHRFVPSLRDVQVRVHQDRVSHVRWYFR